MTQNIKAFVFAPKINDNTLSSLHGMPHNVKLELRK